MLIIISPAKTLDYNTPSKIGAFTKPDYLNNSQKLISQLRRMQPHEIAGLMKVSDKIAKLNFDRFQTWDKEFTEKNAKQCLLAFKGDVYTGLDAESFNLQDFNFAQKHLRILSGLYGLLRPLDLMQAYRLEMGTKLSTKRGNNLYAFWGSTITDGLNAQLAKIKSDTVINLASNEYFKAVKSKELNAEIITPVFKELKHGNYKTIGIYAKKARGLMSRYIIQHRMNAPEDIKTFSEGGYMFSQKLSKGNAWVFVRHQT
ncbi:MAG: peroxide stress protein YaaA [Gammaproteobacteria bacterium]|nr:peroxide stress protein YaaA [Gammaproteobacteria bacterium]